MHRVMTGSACPYRVPWGAGLPTSGKLAKSHDIAAGLNIAYFNFLIFYLIIVIKILLSVRVKAYE